jgi:hypothetical protein
LHRLAIREHIRFNELNTPHVFQEDAAALLAFTLGELVFAELVGLQELLAEVAA